jgi:C1A family cysteine protease
MKEWQEKQDVKWYGYMSPQFVYNNRYNQTSEGMYSRDVMQILNKVGIVPESSYGYGTIEKDTDISEDLLKSAEKYQIKSYASVDTIDGLKKSLIKNGPCYIAFPVYNYGSEFWNKGQSTRMLGGHAVSIVGYTKDSFIIRNSWGDKWGDEGYTYYPFSQWGTHWEVWTAVDEETSTNRVVSWWRKLVWFFKSLF